MHVLIIGGTQFIGKCVVRKLLARGHAVTIFTRGRARPEFWDQVEHIIGDRRDEQRFHAQLLGRQFDAVIDTIAYDAAAVSAALRTFAGRIGHYLLCSSGAVYRDYPDWRRYRPVYEGDADLTYTGDLAYAEGKRAAEQVLWLGTTKVPFTIMRPSVVEGPEDPSGRTWFWIQRVADGHEVLVPTTSPTSMFRHAYVEDVAEAFIRALANPVAFHKAYNLAGEEFLSVDDYVRAIADTLGRDVRMVRVPLDWLRRQPGLSGYQAPFVGERFVQDIARVKHDLQIECTPLGVCLKETVQWFAHEYRGPASAHFTDRAQEIAAAQAWMRETSAGNAG